VNNVRTVSLSKLVPDLKTLLVECLTPKSKPRIDEVSDIAKVVGYNVVGQVTQHREAVDSAYCIGEGKLDEISKTIGKDSIEVLIFTRQLSAGQIFRIKKKLGEEVRVLDRNLLILEVFEKRAATREAKLQIALARLRYTFSWGRESIRMRGIASEQMGRGGPGRYPYEVYEAMSRKRISKIERELSKIRSKKANLREHRGKAGFRTVALTGYTQSGKTTLFNMVALESKETGRGPFTTLSTFARKVSIPGNGESAASFILIDSIGFIEDLNPLLLNAFHTTLNELANSDLILLLVDGSESIGTAKRKLSASHEVMEKEISGVPVLICINKVDIASREHLDNILEETRKIFGSGEIVEISSKTGANVPDLLQKIAEKLNA
jgi:GTP-binding protein HflX